MEANTSNYLYIGVISDSVTDFGTAMNKAGMWTVQADGYVYDNGSGSSKGASAKLMTGARLVVVLDMDAKRVEFLVNGSSVATCSVSASRVTLAACFGGSGQKLKLVGAAAGAASGAGSGAVAGGALVRVGEEQLVTEGKWSTKMATMDQAVGVAGRVVSVTVALSDKPAASDFSSQWELHVYDKGAGATFTLREKASFVVDTANRGPQTVALSSPVAVTAAQRLGVFCSSKDIYLKCLRGTGGKWW